MLRDEDPRFVNKGCSKITLVFSKDRSEKNSCSYQRRDRNKVVISK